MLINPGQYEITFVTPSRKDNGILKLNLRQVYASLPIRITVPRRSSATLPLNNPRVFVAGFAAKVHYGATCQCQNGVFEAIGLSTLVDSEGFREIRGSHMNNWVGFKEGLSDKQRNDGGMLMRASTSKTGIVEVRNVVFHVPGVYKIAFELQFESGELVGRTPWQTVEVQRVRKSNRCELTN